MTKIGESENQLVLLPTEAVQSRIEDAIARAASQAETNPLARYVRSVSKAGDWEITEQSQKMLPAALTAYISLNLRDEGHALIEETRGINNLYVGQSFRRIEVLLLSDIEIIDLKHRILDWGERLCREVIYKLRYRAKEDPFATFQKSYDTFVTDLDGIVFGRDRMFQLVWAPVMDMIPFKLIERFFVEPGLFTLKHESGSEHRPWATGCFVDSPHASELARYFSLYGLEAVAYAENIVLRPLLDYLKSNDCTRDLSELEGKRQACLEDLFEAYPYLLLCGDSKKYVFNIPGSNCYGCVSFTTLDGIARFIFNDTEKSLLLGLESGGARGTLDLGWDGKLSYFMHPWKSIDHTFGYADAICLAQWLFEQVHERIVNDYLSAESSFLHRSVPLRQGENLQEMSTEEQTLYYASWVWEAQRVKKQDIFDEEKSDSEKDSGFQSSIPQIRRNFFFKLLRACGVRIEQGKGSEIKLLRQGKHPFRLGNHGYVNPTIPSFLIANILRRLEISHSEWTAAVASL